MKKIISLFLILCSFLTWPSGFAAADGDINVSKGKTYTINSTAKKNNNYTPHNDCNSDAHVGTECTPADTNALFGECEKRGTSYVCMPKACVNAKNFERFLDVANATCLPLENIQAKCDRQNKDGSQCSSDLMFAAMPEKNRYDGPIKKYKGKEYGKKVASCKCVSQGKVTYDCGSGQDIFGEAPESTFLKNSLEKNRIKKNSGSCSKLGSSFSYWLCNGKVYKEGTEIEVFEESESGILNCIAQYEWNKYTVTFGCGDGASGSVSSQEIVYNNPVKMPDVSVCKKLGYTLTGWKTGDIDVDINGSVTITKDTKITAQWQKCPDCTPGDGCDCEVTTEDNKCKYITKAKDGFVLSSGDGTQNPQCISVGEKDCKDKGGLWDGKKCIEQAEEGENPEFWTVGFYCGGGASGTLSPMIVYDNNNTINLPDGNSCKKAGYEFVGWKEKSKSDDEYQKETIYTVSRDIEFVAVWRAVELEIKKEVTEPEEKKYTIKFVCEDGTVLKEDTILENQTITMPSTGCEKDGFILSGWDAESLGQGVVAGDPYTVTQDVTFVAAFTEESKPEEEKEDKCPDGETGIYPVCCSGDKEYDADKNECVSKESEPEIEEPEAKECPSGTSGTYPECKCSGENRVFNKETEKCDCKDGFKEDENGKCVNKLEELEEKYTGLKETEQSLENRMLGGLTMAATGIGGMELAQGLAEQKAAAAAEQDMSAYIATFRCTYGKDKSVKGGPDEIELPGGNDANMMKYRNEYMTLAADLKVRKEALEMKPGIESEEILDKSQMGLYDQENTGIESGAYASLYRAKMLGSEEDQAKLDEEAKKSKARVIGGATALGVGVVGGMIGNSLINGKLGEKIREKKDQTSSEPGDLNSNDMINENLQRMEE